LTVFSIGAFLAVIVGLFGFSIYEIVSENMILLKIIIAGLTGGIAGTIIGKCSNFAQKRLGQFGDALIGTIHIIVFLLIIFMPYIYEIFSIP
jgi:hypothetical protein